jgi:hypothetical protein
MKLKSKFSLAKAHQNTGSKLENARKSAFLRGIELSRSKKKKPKRKVNLLRPRKKESSERQSMKLQGKRTSKNTSVNSSKCGVNSYRYGQSPDISHSVHKPKKLRDPSPFTKSQIRIQGHPSKYLQEGAYRER